MSKNTSDTAPRSRNMAAASVLATCQVARGAPRHREGLLGRRAVLRPQTRRAPRCAMGQRRFRQRRDPCRALLGSGQGPGRRQDRRRPPRRPDGVRRPPRADGAQGQDEPRRHRPRPWPHEDRGVLASTIRARATKAWAAAGLEPITPHEARHCAISYFIAAGLDWKQISTWAGHGDVRQTWNRYGHLVPGGEEAARQRLDAYLNLDPPRRADSSVRR